MSETDGSNPAAPQRVQSLDIDSPLVVAPARSASLGDTEEPPPPSKPAPRPPANGHDIPAKPSYTPKPPPSTELKEPDLTAVPEKPILKRDPSAAKDLGPDDQRQPRLSFNDKQLSTDYLTFGPEEYDRKNKDVDPLRTQIEVAREKRAAEELLKPKLIPVCLDTRGKGPGFSIVACLFSGKQTACIGELVEGSRAAKDGRFKEGDRIVEVDGRKLEFEPLTVVQEVLDGITDISNFVLGRGGSGVVPGDSQGEAAAAAADATAAAGATNDSVATPGTSDAASGEWEDKLRQAVLDKTAAEQKVLELEVALSDTQGELDDMEEDMAEYHHRAKTAEAKLKELEGAAVAQKELEKHKRLLQASQKSLAAEKETSSKVKEQLDGSVAKVNQYLALNTALQEKVAELEASRPSEESSAAAAELEEKLEASNAENKSLAARVKALEAEVKQERTLRTTVEQDLVASKKEAAALSDAARAAPASTPATTAVAPTIAPTVTVAKPAEPAVTVVAATEPASTPESAKPAAAVEADGEAGDPFGLPTHDLLNVSAMRDRRSASMSRTKKQRPPTRRVSQAPQAAKRVSLDIGGVSLDSSTVDDSGPVNGAVSSAPQPDADASAGVDAEATPPAAAATVPAVNFDKPPNRPAPVPKVTMRTASSSSLDKAKKFGQGLGLAGLKSHLGLKKRNSVEFVKIEKPDPTSKPLSTWSVDDVCIWVEQINNGDLSKYAALFRDKAVDGPQLGSLNSNQALKELGVAAIGHRMLFRTRISNLS